MSGFVDIILYISIALIYNLFVHNLASITYKNLQYEEKHDSTVVMLVIFGVIGIVISKLVIDKNKKYKNSVVSKGLKYGGVLLLLTALFANWENIADEMKLLIVGGILGYLIWYSYQRDDINESDSDKVISNKNKNNKNNKNNPQKKSYNKQVNNNTDYETIQIIEDILKNTKTTD